MNALEITKKVVPFVAGFGASKITGTIIKNNVPVDSLYEKVTVTAGQVVIGMMVAHATEDFAKKQIDEMAASFRKIKKAVKEEKAKKEKK